MHAPTVRFWSRGSTSVYWSFFVTSTINNLTADIDRAVRLAGGIRCNCCNGIRVSA
jgi:hypothetical protein